MLRLSSSYLSRCAGKVSLAKPGLPERAGLREATPTGRCGEAGGEASRLVSSSLV